MAEPVRADRPGDQLPELDLRDQIAEALAAAQNARTAGRPELATSAGMWMDHADRVASVLSPLLAEKDAEIDRLRQRPTVLGPEHDECVRCVDLMGKSLRERVAERDEARGQVVALGLRLDALFPRMVEVAIFARDGNWSNGTIGEQVGRRLERPATSTPAAPRVWQKGDPGAAPDHVKVMAPDGTLLVCSGIQEMGTEKVRWTWHIEGKPHVYAPWCQWLDEAGPLTEVRGGDSDG